MDKGKEKTPKEIATETFENWIEDLQEQEQPESCSIDNNEDCEACGS